MPEGSTENTPLINNEGGANQVRVFEAQNQQLGIIYLIHLLSTISTYIFIYDLVRYQLRENDGIRFGFRVYPSFIIAQILFGIVWGYYCDKSGRKRVLNICLLGSALTMFLFGFCNSIGPATFVSFLVGAFSCVYSVIKTIFGESTNQSNRPLSYIFLIILNTVALFIGSSISAPFRSPIIIPPIHPSHPHNQANFPSLIPCSIACGINIIAFILSHCYLSETLGNSVNSEENDNSISSTNHPNTLGESELYTIFGLSISKDSILIVTGFLLIAVIFNGFGAVFIDWSSNEVSKGGLNLSANQISICLASSSIISLLALILYHSIHKRLGSLKLYKTFFLPSAALFILSSMITLVASTGNAPVIITLVIFLVSTLNIFDYLQDISLNLLLIESSELTGNLGILFGISSALTSTFKFIVPGLFLSIYEFSTERGLPFPLNYNLVWIILTIVTLIGYLSSSEIENL
jgi:MFS family permease